MTVTYPASYIETPIGTLYAQATDKGIATLEFVEGKTLLNMEKNIYLEQLQDELKDYFMGIRKIFSVSLDLKGTVFQQQVWHQLSQIEYGTTISYKQQAIQLQNLKAIRAIAHANGTNKIAILVPCHRVVGSDGSLTGYAGGIWRKEWLLQHEAKHSGKAIQASLF